MPTTSSKAFVWFRNIVLGLLSEYWYLYPLSGYRSCDCCLVVFGVRNDEW